MAKNLVIVESPSKAKTLSKYLGRDFTVKASVGHVIDLPKSKLGVDVEKDFEPEYEVIHGKKKIIDELKKAAKDKDAVYLAPDPDREGEAIAWHIAQALPKKTKIHRVLFNEITKKAVLAAIEKPQKIDQNLFEAQQARRVLDRLVGYQMSPLLWRKVRRGLSAGRVQSVAVRLIVEREKEIEAFVADEYWSLDARLAGKTPPEFTARLHAIDGKRLDHKKLRLGAKGEVDGILSRLGQPALTATEVEGQKTVRAEHATKPATWTVAKVEKKERKRSPAPPFITSRLQQEASRKLGYVPRRTMSIAQRLYEGIELGEAGGVGLITYMRTDSTRLSNDAVGAARDYIRERYGAEYLPEGPVFYRSKKDAQDAHEAIRPTSLEWTPEKVARYLSREELALYTLIWNRFVACQMTPARFDQTAVDFATKDPGLVFRATGQVMRFDGFIRVYLEGLDDKRSDDDEESDDERQLPELALGDRVELQKLQPEQHFTQPPPRFSQAALIKELEEKGIGRPSTYASIMGTILSKEYVTEDKERRLRPTALGRLVTDLLVGSFPDILNVEFTAGMEDELDAIEGGTKNWVDSIRGFYKSFKKDLVEAEKSMPSVKGEGQKTDLVCEKCGAPMAIKWGRQGEFLACTKYPECRNSKNFTYGDEGEIVVEEVQVAPDPCPKCGKEMVVKNGRFGKFLGCTGYPECKQITSLKAPPKSIGVVCPTCNEGDVQERLSRRGKTFYGCNRYPDCTFAAWDPPVLEPCPQCGAPYVVEKVTKREGKIRKCVQEGCGWKEAIDDVAEDAGAA